MKIALLALLPVVLMLTSTVSAQRKEIPLTPSQNPSGTNLPFSQAVWVGDTLYVSGWLDPDLKTHTDVKSQTVGTLEDMKTFLASQKLSMGDVAMMREYLQNDPARDAKADLLGFRAGFFQFFGNKDQPNKPANTLIMATLPSAARGALIEIDMIVVRPSVRTRDRRAVSH